MNTPSPLTIGKYTILHQIGQGGMATVYLAIDPALQRQVAIKVIHPDKENASDYLRRFQQEAQFLARLQHPNIVGVIDYGEQSGSPYLVMEYVSGGTLPQRYQPPLPWQQAADLLAPIASALAAAHRAGIIHRDVKPANILITASGEPMLSDFGIARLINPGEQTNLTRTGMGVGTAKYMAPEQWLGKAEPRSDIYSLGAVFYELITGQTPFTGDTDAALLLRVMNEPPLSPRLLVPSLPVQVENLLLKTLAKQPADRFNNMDEVASILDQFARGNLEAGNFTPPDLTLPLAFPGGVSPDAPTRVQTASLPTVAARPPSPQRKGWTWFGIAAGALLLAGITFALTLGFLASRTAAPATAISATIPPLPTITLPPSVTPSPTPVPTATLTPQPSPTSTPAIPGKRVLNLDFERGSMEGLRSLVSILPAIANESSGNAVLQISKTNEMGGFTLDCPDLQNGSIQFRMRYLEIDRSKDSDSPPYPGQLLVHFRITGNRPDIEQSILMTLNPIRKEVILNHFGAKGNITDLDIKQYRPAETNQWFTVRIDMDGKEIKVFIDGRQVTSGIDDRLEKGPVRFLLGGYTSSQFDDIQVYSR
ncbi:MAG TPA: protein kinase [Anaerolineaceae bacterium]